MKKILLRLVVVAALALPCATWAQTSSINAFSPYSMYGIGELNTQGVLSSRSMGGVGVAMRNPGVVNLFNPAAFSATHQKSFLFNFGLEGQSYFNKQQSGDLSKKNSHTSFNFHDIAFQLPITKGLGLGFSLTPYSSVGYRMAKNQVDGNFGWGNYSYQGEGDITEVKVGMGWEVFKNFSIGLSAQYYWGDINRDFTMTPTNIVDNSTIVSTIGKDKYSISSIKGQVGVQWDVISSTKRILTLGATFDFGGDLNPEVTKHISVGDMYNTTVKGDTTHLALILPHQLAFGVTYQTPKWVLGLDYVYQSWGSQNRRNTELSSSGFEVAYKNTSTIKFGVEYTPNRYDIRHFLNRWSYRMGVRYGGYNQSFGSKDISQYAVTAGIGIPVKSRVISAINIGVEYGSRGANGNIADRIGIVKQQYFKFAIGFSLFAGAENGEYWFLRPKYE